MSSFHADAAHIDFERDPLGNVLVRALSTEGGSVELTIPSGNWSEIVASVSAWGVDDESRRRALVFHNGVGKPSAEVLAQRIAASQQAPAQVAMLMRESVSGHKDQESG